MVVGDPAPRIEVDSGAFPGDWERLIDGVKQFSDREYTLTEIPSKLVGARFFQGPCHANVVSLRVLTIGAVVVLESTGASDYYGGRHITISPPVMKSLHSSMKSTSYLDISGFWQHGM